MITERRDTGRIPVGIYVEQVIDELPYRCFATSLSASGLYVERPSAPMTRRSKSVQIELPLPGGERLWTAGEVVYDCVEPLFHGTAIRFTTMARAHANELIDWIRHASRTLEAALEPSIVVRAGAGISIHRPARRR